MTSNIQQTNSSRARPKFFDLLNLRTEFEAIVSYRRTFDLPTYNSDIDSLYYFVEHGAKNNRFRKRFDEAMTIAKQIIEGYEYEKANLSSLHGEEK